LKSEHRCPITYEDIPVASRYSQRGLRRLSKTLADLRDLPYSAEEQIIEARKRSSKMSIQGVQPKLSAKLRVKESIFSLVEQGGTYILKPPQRLYPFLPENEDLCMKMAGAAKIPVPLHGLIYAQDGTLTYFVKRFDRMGRGKKRPLEDFAQLSGKSRDTKYGSSMEQVVSIINEHCSFPMIERMELFRRTLFCFLVGNEDMHLKNFSLLTIDGKITLSPAYDMVNTSVYYTDSSVEELALPLKGKKKNLTRNDFLKYFAQERLQLESGAIESVLESLREAIQQWEQWIARSFLDEPFKEAFRQLVNRRRIVLKL
jgi:serine/threonine-protein kinase HipA